MKIFSSFFQESISTKLLGGLVLSITAIALTANSAFASKAKYGPRSSPVATPLAASHKYFQSGQHPAPDFWALVGYYIPQYNEAACSAASVTMALNAARALLPKTSDDKLILQPELIDKTNQGNWKERLSKEGFGASKIHGVKLDVLREIAESAFRNNGFPKASVTSYHVKDLSDKTIAQVHQDLIENEKTSKDFILANFDQKVFTDDTPAGHIAPVGAYDAENRKVLIMDPDREWFEPYWISEQKFLEGMHTKDAEADEYRGYVFIKLNQGQ